MTAEELKNLLDNAFKSTRDGLDAANKRADELENRMNLMNLSMPSPTGKGNDPANLAVAFANMIGRPVDTEAYGQYNKALSNWIRRGDALPVDIRNALSVGSDPAGGYWVTPDLRGRIMEKVYQINPMRRLATVTPIGTDALEGLVDDEEAESGWVSETGTRSETTTPNVKKWRVPLFEHYALPKSTQQLLDDAAFPVETWLVNKVARRLARLEGVAFVSGNGSGQPKGFLDYTINTTADATRAWNAIQYIPTGAAGAFPTSNPADKLLDMVYTLKSEYRQNAAWQMNSATAATVRKFKSGDGHYLWSDSLVAGQPPQLCGFPAVINEDMPAIGANSYSIAFGDWREAYQIVDHNRGLRILRDPFTQKGFVLFYCWTRTGGGLVNGEALKLLKFAVS